jgi:hypothetical protein
VHDVAFEIVCVPTGNPVKARLAVLPPLPERSEPSLVLSDSDDTAEEESSDVLRLSKTPGLLRYEEPNGAKVELLDCSEARGYDSHLVVRGSWAFNACDESQLRRKLF